MNDNDKAELDAAISLLEHQIMGLAISLSMANSKLDEMRDEVERLKALRDGKRFESQASMDFNLEELSVFIESVPHSVRSRVVQLAETLEETGDALIVKLLWETREMLLYDAIYADVDDLYDLSNPMLSRIVRGCVDHDGRVPDGADRDALLRECPQILNAVENAYKKHNLDQLKAIGRQMHAHFQTMGRNYR